MNADEVPEDIQNKIVKAYRDDELTQRQVASRCGVALHTVINVLRVKGVKINKEKRFNG